MIFAAAVKGSRLIQMFAAFRECLILYGVCRLAARFRLKQNFNNCSKVLILFTANNMVVFEQDFES